MTDLCGHDWRTRDGKVEPTSFHRDYCYVLNVCVSSFYRGNTGFGSVTVFLNTFHLYNSKRRFVKALNLK